MRPHDQNIRWSSHTHKEIEANNLVNYIRSHGHNARVNDQGTIDAEEVYSDGTCVPVTLPANRKAVRDWLGY